MKKIAAFILIIVLISFNSSAVLADNELNELPQCVVKTHCERLNWEVDDVDQTFLKALEVVSNTPRTKIVEVKDGYIHAEATTKWMRYVDDLEIKALKNRGILQVRSESRVGIGDNGVNKKRVEDLAYRLITNQIR